MIPFRRQRLATSVVNRILNLYDELPRPQSLGDPAAPGPVPGGQQLDARLAAPTPPVTGPADELTGAVATGKDLIDGA